MERDDAVSPLCVRRPCGGIGCARAACLPACLQVLQALPSLKAHAEGLHRYDGLAIIRPGAPEGISSAEAASVGPLRRAAETAAGGARDLPGPGRSGGPEGLL